MKKMNLLVATATAMVLFGVTACNRSTPVEQPEVASTAEKAPEPPKVGTDLITPRFPDAAAADELKLDYVSFQQVDPSGVSAVPLPPYVQAKTKLHLAPNANGFDIVGGNTSCVGAMALFVDEKEVALLDPSKGTVAHHLSIDAATAPQGVELAVAMAPTAEANFNCNITIRPAEINPAS